MTSLAETASRPGLIARRASALAGSIVGLASVALAPAHAASGSLACSFGSDTTHTLCSDISWTSATWVLGDKYFVLDLDNTNFSTTSGSLNFNYLDTGSPDPDYTGDLWSVVTDFDPDTSSTGTSGSLAYSLGITPAGQAAGWSFKEVALGVDHSGTGIVVSKAVNNVSIISNEGADFEGIPLSGTLLSVTDTWEVQSSGQVNSISNSYEQGQGVPGPLPLLGAGAAFGFSRQIRKRIRRHNLA
ncbi:MAG: hypothetical protein VKI42_02655 [Synechococcaceae cyanobacterium]|nr:hypothetical protein [Synechococcaceae cyanobacterium]